MHMSEAMEMTDVGPEANPGIPENPVIVVPTYNEAENLPRMLEALREEIPGARVLVVDDNSPDGTGALADAAAAEDEQIRVLHRTAKEGLGAAYVAGFARALADGHDAVVQMDCDFSHSPQAVPMLLDALADVDLAIGSRYVPGGSTPGWGMTRKLISRGGSFYARTILGMHVRDLTGGFKAWRADLLRRIDLNGILTRGYGFQIEMTYRAHQAGARIAELPIAFEDRQAGQSKMSMRIALEAFANVWKLRWRVR